MMHIYLHHIHHTHSMNLMLQFDSRGNPNNESAKISLHSELRNDQEKRWFLLTDVFEFLHFILITHFIESAVEAQNV